MSFLKLAVKRIVFSRDYTIGLLDQTPTTDWFRQPPAGITHIAWQVGHLTFAEYRLALYRIRGTRPEHDGLVTPGFVRLFGIGAVPDADSRSIPRKRKSVRCSTECMSRFYEKCRGLRKRSWISLLCFPILWRRRS